VVRETPWYLWTDIGRRSYKIWETEKTKMLYWSSCMKIAVGIVLIA